MRIRFTLQFKLLLFIALVIILAFLILVYLTINQQSQILEAAFRERAVTLARALDAGIGSRAELEDRDKLQSNIYKLIWLNPDIIKISIALPSPEGLKIAASNDTSSIGSISSPESKSSYEKGLLLTKSSAEPDGTQVLTTITPVHIGGQRVGIYDIRLSLESLKTIVSQTQRQFFLIMLGAIAIIIAVLFLLLRIMVINPIYRLQKGAEIIGKGNLDYKIEIKRKDEIGDLAQEFNKMTKELQASYKNLEEKVVERTQQLDQKIKELEKFNKMAVGRELKMIELKKEIKRLKREIERLRD